MKKISFYLLAFCFLFSALTLKAQQLTGGDFETGWSKPNGYYGPYWEFKTDYFYTLNSLRAVINTQGAADITVEQDGNAQQGNWCIKLISGKIPVGEDVFLPGLVGTINTDFVNEFLGTSGNVTIFQDWFGYNTPHAMEGWYKYSPVGGDSALFDIGFHKDDNPEPLFVQKLILKDKVNNWTKFRIEIPKQYWDVKFTDIRVLFVASAGVNFEQLMKCKGQIGSTLWIDNIYLDYTTEGIKQNLFSSLAAKAYPNPATDVVNIELNEYFSGKILIYNLLGGLVMEESVSGTEYQFNISNLSTGNYIYKLMNENTIFAQGKFVVTK